MVHKYPHEVTIYAGGPMTDIAQAISLDPEVPDLAQELVVMGGSIAPAVPHDWIAENRREFNFWWDPEAVHIVLTLAVAQSHDHHGGHLGENADDQGTDRRNREIQESGASQYVGEICR